MRQFNPAQICTVFKYWVVAKYKEKPFHQLTPHSNLRGMFHSLGKFWSVLIDFWKVQSVQGGLQMSRFLVCFLLFTFAALEMYIGFASWTFLFRLFGSVKCILCISWQDYNVLQFCKMETLQCSDLLIQCLQHYKDGYSLVSSWINIC